MAAKTVLASLSDLVQAHSGFLAGVVEVGERVGHCEAVFDEFGSFVGEVFEQLFELTNLGIVLFRKRHLVLCTPAFFSPFRKPSNLR